MDQIDRAISESIQYDRIVTITASADEFEVVDRELSARSDDGVDTTGRDGVRCCECWGRDDEGNDWRVHLGEESTSYPDEGY